MAMVGPNAPTPPSAPVVPKVTLGGQAAVTESTAEPAEKPSAEQQAKASVAKGEGALGKTEVQMPDLKKPEAKKETETVPQSKSITTVTESGGTVKAGADATTVAVQDAKLARDGAADQGGKEQGALQGSLKVEEPSSGHGVFYWGFTLISIVIFVAVLFRIFFTRKKGTESFFDATDWRKGKSSKAAESKAAAAKTQSKDTARQDAAKSTLPMNARESVGRAADSYAHTKDAGKELGKKSRPAPKNTAEDGHFEVRV